SVYYTLFGWIHFSMDVLPKVELNERMIIQSLFMILFLLWGGHAFMRWFYTSWSRGEKRWPWRWSFLSLLAVLLFFMAGIGTIGAVHQLGWLKNEERALLVDHGLRFRFRYVQHDIKPYQEMVENTFYETGDYPQPKKITDQFSSTLIGQVALKKEGIIKIEFNPKHPLLRSSIMWLKPKPNKEKKLVWSCYMMNMPESVVPRTCSLI
ncbi:hypothetical protein ACQZV8_11480, partial [Magnetococcales bacterium HHB-1]